MQRIEIAPERTEPDRTLVLVIETRNEDAILESEVASLSTPMPHPAIATTLQKILATPITAQM